MKSHVPVSAEIPPELKPMRTPLPIMKRFPRVLCRISATLYATFLMASGISEAAAPSSFRPGEIWPDNTPEAWKKPLASAELESLDGYDKVFFRDFIGGPWTELGNPCVGPADRVNITFEGQSTHVIPVTGRPGAFILMADRWRPGNAIDGRHLWYPFVVGTDGKVRIEEHDAWDLSVFDLKPFDAKRAPRITPNANGDAAKPDTADWADARLLAETTK